MQLIVLFFFISFFIFLFAIIFLGTYYIFFSRKNIFSKIKMEKKINNLIKKNELKYEEVNIKNIDGVYFLIDKKNNKYYSI